MKEFFEEFFYMCSANNTKSRGTYLMLAAILVLLPIVFIAGVIAEIVYIGAGNFQIMPAILAVLALVGEIALIVWLKKS